MGRTAIVRMNPPVKLSCKHVWKVYGDHPGQFFRQGNGLIHDPVAYAEEIRKAGHIVACGDVSFDVHVGEIFVIMGLSGSGKSTVVRCLSRLVEPTAGEVLLDQEDLLRKNAAELIEIRRHQMGMVFQSFGLLPHLNVIDNIAFPLKLQGLGLPERRERAQRVIDLVGLDGREKSFPSQLSGGQQQRVGIARSLAVEPDLWFLDEPFSALDPLIRREMQNEFLQIQEQLQKSIIFITHDFLEALRIADRMMIMKDGHIVQVGTPAELIVNPADEYVSEFTNDVPVTRVLTARSVIRDLEDSEQGADLPQVDSQCCIEDLLPLLAEASGVRVCEEGGAVLGIATAEGVIRALARENASHGH